MPVFVFITNLNDGIINMNGGRSSHRAAMLLNLFTLEKLNTCINKYSKFIYGNIFITLPLFHIYYAQFYSLWFSIYGTCITGGTFIIHQFSAAFAAKLPGYCIGVKLANFSCTVFSMAAHVGHSADT